VSSCTALAVTGCGTHAFAKRVRLRDTVWPCPDPDRVTIAVNVSGGLHDLLLPDELLLALAQRFESACHRSALLSGAAYA
jgi:hypothetical protein